MYNEQERSSDILVKVLIDKVDKLHGKLDEHILEEEKKIQELLDAWKTGKSVVWFIKVAAAVVGSVAIAWAWVTDHLSIGVK